MRIYLLLTTLIGLAQAVTTRNLDDENVLAEIIANGLTFTSSTPRIDLKITSSKFDIDQYNWFVDDLACENVIDIKSVISIYPPEDDLAGFDKGYAEAIFELQAKSTGNCTFRYAYASREEFTDFDDYEKKNGTVIAVSVVVESISSESESKIEKIEIECDEAVENCTLKEEYGIGKKQERAFKIMGIQAWIRGFTGTHLFVFLPQAIAWTRAKNGHQVAAERFLWMTKWYCQISGWISSLIVLWAGMLIIELFYMPGKKNHQHLLAPQVGDHKDGLFNIFWSDRPGDVWFEILGWMIWFVEFACWFMFYWTIKDAKQYARYLIASGADYESETNPF